MATERKHGRGRGVAWALPVLLLLWPPSPPPWATGPGGGCVLSGSLSPLALASAPSAKDPAAGTRLCAATGAPGAPSAPAAVGAFPRMSPRATDAVLPAIRIAPPGRPGRPNLSRAPPRA